MEILFVFRHGFKEFYDHRKCDRSGYDIRDGLGYLNSGESKDSVHDTEDGNENESASDHGQEGSTAILSNALEEHVSIEGKWHEEEGDALDTQGGNTDGKDCRVITEHAHDGAEQAIPIKAEMLITTKLLFTLNQKALRTRLYFPAP